MNITFVSATSLYVNPYYSYGGAGTTFTKDIIVSDVTDLYGYEFKLTWNPYYLECTDVKVHTPWTSFLEGKNQKNNVQGYYYTAYSASNPILKGFSGSISLVTLTFRVKNAGSSPLTLTNDKLSSSTTKPISHSKADGYYRATKPSGTRPTALDLNSIIDLFKTLFGLS